jgi:hypothetical protein
VGAGLAGALAPQETIVAMTPVDNINPTIKTNIFFIEFPLECRFYRDKGLLGYSTLVHFHISFFSREVANEMGGCPFFMERRIKYFSPSG